MSLKEIKNIILEQSDNNDPFGGLGGYNRDDIERSPKSIKRLQRQDSRRRDDDNDNDDDDDNDDDGSTEVPDGAEVAVAKWLLNRTPERRDCYTDFADNLAWYSGVGGFMAWTLWPIASPLAKMLLNVTFNLFAFWRWPGNIRAIRTAAAAYSASATSKGSGFGARLLVNTGAYIKSIVGIAAAGKALKNVGGLIKNGVISLGLWNPGRSGNALLGFGKDAVAGVWNTIKTIKGIALGVALLGTAYWGYLKITGGGEKGRTGKPDAEGFQGGIEEVLKAVLLGEMSLEVGLGLMNPDIETECSIQNIFMGAGIVTLFFSGAINGGKIPNSIPKDSPLRGLKNTTSADEVANVLKLEQQFQTQRLHQILAGPEGFTVGLKNAGITLESAKNAEYVNLLLLGKNKQALKVLKDATGMKNKKALAAHSQVVAHGNTITDDFLRLYSQQFDKMKSSTRVAMQKNLDDIKLAKKQLLITIRQTSAKINNKAGEATKIYEKSRMATGADEAFAVSEYSKVVASNLDDLAALSRSLDELVVLDPAKAVSIYQKNFMTILKGRSDELATVLSSGGRLGGITGSSQNIANQYLKILTSINKNQQYFDDVIAMIQKGGPSLAQITSRGRAASSLKKAKSSQIKVDEILYGSILKANGKVNPKDVTKLGNELNKFNNNVAKAAGINLDSLTGAEKLIALSAVTGLSYAILYNEFKDVADITNIDVWRGCELARSLAWNEWRPFEKTVDYNSRALMELYKDILLEPLMVRTFYVKYLFHPQYLSDEILTEISNTRTTQLTYEFISNKVMELANKYGDSEQLYALLYSQWGAAKNEKWESDSAPNSKRYQLYFEKWIPILVKLLLLNSGLIERLQNLKIDDEYRGLNSKRTKKQHLKQKVFIWNGRSDYETYLYPSIVKCYKIELKRVAELRNLNFEEEWNKLENNKKDTNENISREALASLVKEALQENYGQGYAPYPYNSQMGEEGEAQPDFIQDWKDFEMSVTRDETRNTAIAVAKIFVKDLELFGDVIDLVGKNQSVAVEILKAFRNSKETA